MLSAQKSCICVLGQCMWTTKCDCSYHMLCCVSASAIFSFQFLFNTWHCSGMASNCYLLTHFWQHTNRAYIDVYCVLYCMCQCAMCQFVIGDSVLWLRAMEVWADFCMNFHFFPLKIVIFSALVVPLLGISRSHNQKSVEYSCKSDL